MGFNGSCPRQDMVLADPNRSHENLIKTSLCLGKIKPVANPRLGEEVGGMGGVRSAGITEEGILHLDRPMLDRWWNELGFDDISVWRYWERDWTGAPTPAGER